MVAVGAGGGGGGVRLIGEGPGFKPRPSRSFIRERTLLYLNLSL